MQDREFILWATQPPCLDDLALLEEGAGLADPLVDLRYGPSDWRLAIVARAIERNLDGLTVFVDSNDKELIGHLQDALAPGSRIIISDVPVATSDELASIVKLIKRRGLVAGVDVNGSREAVVAHKAGADFLVASGSEASGLASSKTGLVLMQEILGATPLPLVVRASLGPLGVAGAMAAGCAGAILDSELLLTGESPLSQRQKNALFACTPFDTAVVGLSSDRSYRMLTRGGASSFDSISKEERSIALGGSPDREKAERLMSLARPFLLEGFSENAANPPVGQGIAFATLFAREKLGVRALLERYHEEILKSVSAMKRSFPFKAGSKLAKFHGVTLPLVQGPMALVTDNPGLAKEVSRRGGLPFVATTGLGPEESAKLMRDTRAALGEGKTFGAGIVRFAKPERMEEQVEAVVSAQPDFVTIAGGDPDVARKIEERGIPVYLHAPSPVHAAEFIDRGVRGLIFEGHEAGGHVGALSSLVLWELGITEILNRNDEIVKDMRVLLAGGIATAAGSLVAGAMSARLVERGAAVGLQLGTAYLMTEEAVTTGAIPQKYLSAVVDGRGTLVTGRSINLPSRWLDTPAINKLIENEYNLQQGDVPLSERKKLVERAGREMMTKALEGRGVGQKPDKAPSANDNVAPAYSCGQIISAVGEPLTIGSLHRELTITAERLSRGCPVPKPLSEAAGDDTGPEPIAIVGLGCIFPGATGHEEYWRNIIDKKSAIREVPKERWDPALYYDPAPGSAGASDKTYSKIGAFVEGFKKDPMKFRIPPTSAPCIDRIQFMALETAHQALKDSGYLDRPCPKEKTAVFIGNAGSGELKMDYEMRTNWPRFAAAIEGADGFKDLTVAEQRRILDGAERSFKGRLQCLTEDSCPGVLGSLLAGRITNHFDFGGGAFVLDGACASSLAAIDEGVTALRTGKSDMVLAGGIDIRVDPSTYSLFSSLGALSAKGSFPFDERADGFVLGEGSGLVVMKRLSDAVRDNDRIYCQIRGIGLSTDGKVKGITAPDAKGQARAVENAYKDLPFKADSLSLIEAHGTGTWVGDLTEVTTITDVIRRRTDKKRFIGMGSVKSMIGHLKTAAGIAGLIKTALALHHKTLPPTLNCETPRKAVDWENSPLELITEPRPWASGNGPRRAGINSFGFGGINYHAVLEEAPSTNAGKPAHDDARDLLLANMPAELLILRAPSREGLIAMIAEVSTRLPNATRADMRRLGLELSARKVSGASLAIVAGDSATAIKLLEKARKAVSDPSRHDFTAAQGIYFSSVPLSPDEKIAFVFPGQGSQYVNMGGDLIDAFPFLKGEVFDRVDALSLRYNAESLYGLLFTGDDPSGDDATRMKGTLMRPEYNHPAMLAMGMAVSRVFEAAGVKPQMVAGHSLGEYFALAAAGVFDLDTAIAVTTLRGVGISEHCNFGGAMASVAASEEAIKPYLDAEPGYVIAANKNCPAQTVISGEKAAVLNVVDLLSKEGVDCKMLPVTNGFHTKLLADYRDDFRRFLAGFEVNVPAVSVQSNLYGRAYEPTYDFADYLKDALAEHMVAPVEFIKNVESMYADGARLFIETGPKATLSSFIDNILADKPHWAIATNVPRRSAALQLLHSLAFTACRSVDVNLSAIMPEPAETPKLRRASRRKTHAPTRTLAVAPVAGLDVDALKGEDEALVKRYLAERGEFLKGVIRLDFEHFKNAPGQTQSPSRTIPSTGAISSEIKDRIVGLVARKTGYPVEFIDIDLDVEAELGLDSIKQVEILRETAAEFKVDFGNVQGQRYEITTLRKLVEKVKALRGGDGASIAPMRPTALSEPAANECRRWVQTEMEAPLHPAVANALAGKRVAVIVGSKDSEELGEHLRRLAKESGARAGDINDADVIVDASGIEGENTPSTDECNGWWKTVETTAKARLENAREAAARLKAGHGKALWVAVTRLGGRFASGPVATPSVGAGISLGIIRSLKRELGGALDALYLDFDESMTSEAMALAVMHELKAGTTGGEIGFRDNVRHEISWEPADVDIAKPRLLDRASVVVAIGGGRGITAAICRMMAEKAGARLVIVGRRGLDADAAEYESLEKARAVAIEEARSGDGRSTPAEIDSRAWELMRDGELARNMRKLASLTDATYLVSDVTDPPATRRMMESIVSDYGRIDLVIHGGGDLVQKSVGDFKLEEFLGGMRSKALGTASLVAAVGGLKGVDVGAFINLSSVAGRFGNSGQSSYAAGHEVAACIVAGERQKRPDSRWINVFYGAWLESGMTRTGDTMERLKNKSRSFITEEDGAKFLMDEYACGLGSSVAFSGEEVFGGARAPAGARGFLDHIEANGEKAESHKTFVLDRDRYVSDHYVIYNQPIIPATTSLEMMARTALAIARGGLEVTDIEDFEFLRAGTFPRGEPRAFHSRARRVSPDVDDGQWFDCVFFTIFTPPGSGVKEEMVHARCRIRFGKRLPFQKPEVVLPMAGLTGARLDAGSVWDTKIQKTRIGVYRNIGSFCTSSIDGAAGDVLSPVVRDFGEPALTVNPIRMDGYLHLVVFSSLLFLKRSYHLIGGAKSIRFFGHDDPSRPRLCRTIVREATDDGLLYDAEGVDENGMVTERLTGVRKIKGSLNTPDKAPEAIYDVLRDPPEEVEIRRVLGLDAPIRICHVDIDLVRGAIDADEASLIGTWLHPGEREKFTSLKNPKRRVEWLAGRIAAKGAVRRLLGADAPRRQDVRINGDTEGAPVVEMPGNLDAPFVSISHSNDVAVALAAQALGLGIDVEKISASTQDVKDEFTDDAEIALVSTTLGASPEAALTAIWAMKESARKAHGSLPPLKALSIGEAALSEDLLACHASCGTDDARLRIACIIDESGGYVYAACKRETLK
jgi:acyl transferase domain-containing protein/NAD(P)H-dependent flavin oxidoreductase YrpB (nitropropane dioxygenase family)/NAD(P)-dependent dehydrogenase (short-subunit alcohol dehydrogenase family)/4'-phosphopantetheinyl transferase EntD/acyl carrier protein